MAGSCLASSDKAEKLPTIPKSGEESEKLDDQKKCIFTASPSSETDKLQNFRFSQESKISVSNLRGAFWISPSMRILGGV